MRTPSCPPSRRLLPRLLGLGLALALAACAPVAPLPSPPPGPGAAVPARPDARPDARSAVATFASVLERMEPVVVSECRARAPTRNCDFLIVVDTRPGQPPNAFQTLDRSGRPVIGFTAALIAQTRNADELAFILGHEAGHHIAGHIPRRAEQARTGALIAGALAAMSGADDATVQQIANIGGEIVARRFAPAFELEADRYGTLLAWRAGFDPLRGAAFFTRIPDPGNAFLATHPPNAQRIETVRDTLQRLQRGAPI